MRNTGSLIEKKQHKGDFSSEVKTGRKTTAKTTAKTRKAPKKPAGYQPRFSELDQYLFGQATHYDIFRKMGAHLDKKDGKVGAWFTVWAPHAAEVSVIGEFKRLGCPCQCGKVAG